MLIKLLAALIILIISVSLGYFLLSDNETTRQPAVAPKIAQDNSTSSITSIPSPTPFLGQAITIPYLRKLEYKSSLGGLQKQADRPTYTSYITSYTSDGLKINGLLTEPKGEKPEGGWPAIVFVHGYIPPTQYQTTGQYADYVDYLARNGFVVFKIDLRGHGSSEGDPSGAYYSADYIVDTLNARAALASSDFVNKDKIGLWGHSMAGNVVMRSFATQPEIPAVVVWAGAVYTYKDWREFGIQDNSYRPPAQAERRQQERQSLLDTYGDPSGDNPFWSLVAPTTYLSDLKGAIQIHHAVNDDVVKIGYSRNLNSQLDQTSVEHELYEYPSGGHNISGSSFTQAMQRSVEFYRSHLK